MELVPVDTNYRIRLPNGDEVVMSSNIWPYFRTLHNMTMDCEIENGPIGCVVEIPVPEEENVELTTPIIQSMIDFYSIYHVYESVDKGVEKILVDKDSILHSIPSGQTSADYLYTSELLIFLIDYLYDKQRKESTFYLEERVRSVKRKAGDDETEEEEEQHAFTRKRIQYRREELIQRILESLLPVQLMRGIDRRIRKYANPVTLPVVGGHSDTALIEYNRNSILFYETNLIVRYPGTPDKEAISLSIMRGKEALYRERLNKVVMGREYIAILNESGNLSLYGGSKAEVNEAPIGNQPIVAVFPGNLNVIIVGYESVYLHRQSIPHVPLGRLTMLSPAILLDVSGGYNHFLLLTRNGLYGLGANAKGEMGKLREDSDDRGPFPINVHSSTIKFILARGDHSIVVTTNDIVYATGAIVTNNERAAIGVGQEYDQNLVEWQIVPNTPPRIRMLGGDENRTFLVTESNELYVTGRKEDDFSLHTQFTLMPTVNGEIIHVQSGFAGLFIVTSLLDMYVMYARGEMQHYMAEGAPPDVPYRLNFSLGVKKDSKVEETPNPNKKRRFQCHVCCADAKLRDMTQTRMLCSRYCFHKTIVYQ